ncbi:hypothetical protein BDV97DRAFT_43069 [Delphinella strobiligena]|nr:hypothetical protein BDV97DRAFT_43069 [Delphinella strobiligena]
MKSGDIAAMAIDLVRRLALMKGISKSDVPHTAVRLHEITILVLSKHLDDHIRPQTTAHGVVSMMTETWLEIVVLLKHLDDHIPNHTTAHRVITMTENYLESVATLLPLDHHLPHHLDEDPDAPPRPERRDAVSANADGINGEGTNLSQYHEVVVTKSPTTMVQHPSYHTRLSHWRLQSQPQTQ